MCKTISIINQKGGVGKTTTCNNLAASLVNMGKKVLMVDLDSQANLTMGMGYDNPDELPIKLADLLQAEITKRTTGQNADVYNKEDYILNAHGVDLIPSSLDLAGLELVLMNTIGRETVLKSFLEQFQADYDYILIDCLPSLGIFTVNALTASNEIMAMYAKGMTTREIEEYVRDIYGVDVSPSLVSKITDRIMPEVREWQSRPLDDIYPVMFFDGVWFKGRTDGKVAKKCVYSVLGVTVEGKKEILGIWVSESESASFWTGVFNDMKNRGVKDILIACHDNLTGFTKALETVFPRTESQLCIVHQIRNSLAFVGWKERKTMAADMKQIYSAPTLDDAEYQLEVFREKYGNDSAA